MCYNKSTYRWWSRAACHISLLSLVMMALKEGCLILFNASLRKLVFPSSLRLSCSPPPFGPDERRRLRLEVRNERRIIIRHVGDVGSKGSEPRFDSYTREERWWHVHSCFEFNKIDFQLNSRFSSTAPRSLEFSWHFQNSSAFSTLSQCLFFDSPNRYTDVWMLEGWMCSAVQVSTSCLRVCSLHQPLPFSQQGHTVRQQTPSQSLPVVYQILIDTLMESGILTAT